MNYFLNVQVMSYYQSTWKLPKYMNELASSAVDRMFESRSGQTKDYKIGIWCLSSKHVSLRRKNNDCLARNQDNVSERGGMSNHELLFHWASTMKIQQSVLV